MYRSLKKLNRIIGRLLRMPATLGAALVLPIEHWFKNVVWVLSSSLFWAERRLDNFSQLFWWPIRSVWPLLSRLATLFLPKAFSSWLSAPFRVIGLWSWRLSRWTTIRMAEVANPDQRVLWLLQPVWRPFAALGGFVYAWCVTHNYRQMLWGLPALLLLLPIVLLLKPACFGNSGVASQYQNAVKVAIEEKDYARVQLFERKLAQLGVDNKLSNYRNAVALAQHGKLEEAYERMQRLAPLEELGYPAAHYWIVQRLLAGELDVVEDQAMLLMDSHLHQLERSGFHGADIQLMQANRLLQNKQFVQASNVLKPLMMKVPNAAVQRMQINFFLKNMAEARRDARSVRIHMQERARSDLELTSQEYQWWAFAEEILGDVGQLKSILLRWLEQEPENLQARTSLAEINRFLFVKLLHSVQPNPEVLANLLIDTANLSSDATTLHLLANDLFRQQHPGAQRIRIPIAKKVISHLVHSPRASAPICEALASTTVAAGDLVLAKTLLARAVAQDASQAKVWNNYAWVLNHGSKKDLDRAIGAINRGLELAPNELRFRETRGQILVNLGRWQEAVTDLEYALNGMPGNKQIHISLANAYAALGEDDLAQHHRRQRE